MERQIKFKAFENGRFYFSDSQEDARILGAKLGGSLISAFLNKFYGHETLCQFTGLKDKYGHDIYEGDIYKGDNDEDYIVFFKNGCFCGGKSFESSIPMGFEKNEVIKIDYARVVGNIHQKTN